MEGTAETGHHCPKSQEQQSCSEGAYIIHQGPGGVVGAILHPCHGLKRGRPHELGQI